ncbi:MAG: GNAT family N-acetyltransferase [Bacteroidales bacterium]|nr:GNAT family N-acetyltransferase [Bacteroidales bacterium]
MDKNRLKIGEFSRLGRVTVRALRHYEEIGLLRPEIIDRETSYRYYAVGQLQKIQSIHPDWKRKGYGLKLLNYSIEKAREMGVGVLCMEGNIEFYKHAGFVLASSLGIHYHAEPKESEVPYFLAQELIPGYLKGVEGTYHTPKGYYIAFENPEAFNEFDAAFPPKEKKHQEGQIVDDCTVNPNEA